MTFLYNLAVEIDNHFFSIDNITPESLNNFGIYFLDPNQPSIGNLRWYYREFGKWGTQFVDIFKQQKRTSDRYSERKLAQTPDQFFTTLDYFAIEVGIPTEQIRQLHVKVQTGQLETSEFNQALLPLAEKLLREGYKLADFTS